MGGVWEKRKFHAKFWRGEINERDRFEDFDLDYKILSRLIENFQD
jgi:hypothetical protein